MALSEAITYVRQVPLFAHLSEANLHRVGELAREVTFPRGSLLARLGQPGRALIYIISGEALVRTVSKKHWRPVGYLRPGDSFGATSLLLHSAHNVSQAELDAGVTYLDIMRENLKNLKEALN